MGIGIGAAIVVAAVVVGLVRPSGDLETYVHRPVGIMGTQTMLKVAVRPGEGERAKKALRDAEAALRDVEAHTSTWIDDTEISQLNSAAAGRVVKLSPRTLELLRQSRQYGRLTGGAFDVTCRPILQLWKRAGRDKKLPTEPQRAAALAHCGWEKFELLPGGARKKVGGAGVDRGGIAKGYGIDRAVTALTAAGVAGGIVDVGGDVRCFGKRPGGGKWQIAVRNPFTPKEMFTFLAVDAGAVCTSGNYFRFTEIDGRRYSHIIDPRTGQGAAAAASVTVIAPTATTADAWATALSVLGPKGLGRLGGDGPIHAMLIVGRSGDHTVHLTARFVRFLTRPLPGKVVHQPKSPASAPSRGGGM